MKKEKKKKKTKLYSASEQLKAHLLVHCVKVKGELD